MVGDSWTIADFYIFGYAYSRFMNEHNPSREDELKVAEKYPVFFAYIKHMGEEKKEYLSTRKSSPW